jgi:hypothetical protein
VVASALTMQLHIELLVESVGCASPYVAAATAP